MVASCSGLVVVAVVFSLVSDWFRLSWDHADVESSRKLDLDDRRD